MTHSWWHRAVIYQIYPRSFRDTTGNGVGDLAGILERLDYLSGTLGIDALWLSPFYPSPMEDFGYDVADYRGVDPLFGTLDTFDRLVAEAHARDLKLIVDFVPNHSSDQHPWFQESRSSRENPKRDWYVWADPALDGGPPNNWRSIFGGSAWEWDENSTTSTPSSRSSRTSTGATQRCERRCSTSSASGWIGAWTGFGSTWRST